MNKIAFLLLILLLKSSFSSAQWAQMNGPYGESNVIAILEHNSHFFIATEYSGLFSKVANGNKWDLNSTNYFKTFAQKGDSLFASAQYFSGGLSRDMGIQLFDLSNPNAGSMPINPSIAPKALVNADSCLFGGDASQGFFKLSYDGSTVDYWNSGLPQDTGWSPWGPYYETNVNSIALADNFIFCGTNYGVYRCDPLLQVWNPKNSGLPLGSVGIVEEFGDSMYAVIENKLFRSSDEGENWVQIYVAQSKITTLQKIDNELLIGTATSGIQQSIDNGINWSPLNAGLTDLSVNFILKQDTVLLCGTQTKGVFVFSNGLWSENNLGMVSSMIRDLTATDSNIVAIDDKQVYRNKHNDFEDITPNITKDIFISIDNMGDTIFVSDYYSQSAWPYFFQFFHYTFDKGLTWNAIGNLPYTSPGGDSSHKLYIDKDRIYAYSSEKMYYSDDLFLTWTPISLPAQFCNNFNDFQVYNSVPFAAACGNGKLLKLDTTNANWLLSNNGLPTDREPLDIAFCDSAIFAYFLVHGMFVSFDNGVSWAPANNGLITADFGIRDFANYGNHLFVTTAKGVFVTSNFGQNWYASNTGLKNINTNALAILHDTLYVGTYGNGIWKRAISDIALSAKEIEGQRLTFSIYPNPANTHFSIALPFEGAMEMQIIESRGKSVLQKSVQSAEKIDVSHLPSGIYLVIVEMEQVIQTAKLLINR